MSTSLPEHPDLDQLRRQAKELRDAARRGDPTALDRYARHHRSARAGEASLAAAQLVIARELGFPSWPTLKAAVDAATAASDDRTQAFLADSIEGRLRDAARLLQADPGVAGASLLAAVVLGDSDSVRAHLAADPEAALAVDDQWGWPPLLYACYSRWHQINPERGSGLADVVRLLLDAGASPNTNNGAFRNGYRSALQGAVEVNNPDIVQALLEAGANADDGRCIEQAADRRDPRCLELLLAGGARVAGTWALGAAVYADSAEAVSLLLRALRTDKGETSSEASSGLADAAAANASPEVVAALLAAGADPDVHDSDAGRSALRCAVRAGNDETAALLVRAGAADDTTDIDRFIGACLAGDRHRAEQLLADHPGLRDRFAKDDRAAIVDAASSHPADTVALMLDLGFSPVARNGFGEQPLHSAAYQGNVAAVRVLLDAGADIDGRDDRFDATPLAFATVGSGEQVGKPGQWTETVRLLIDAGASRDGVWISGKPPSEEVAEILRDHGITPDEPGEEPHADEQVVRPGTIGTGVMAEVARHLEAAYRDEDLDLLGSLLHPDVTWTGLCHNSAQVLDWYRGFQAEGTVATINSMEVDRDAVVFGLSVSRRAEGARP
ncbi:MAG: ankyrin repeat domain-containing protein, partial [Acidimicrobiaceae bacterium]|nr:ankyrin repeat domain-containing protein [Acidimicrobiaceae bacterium]